jgi:cytochrome c oxidase subunit II
VQWLFPPTVVLAAGCSGPLSTLEPDGSASGAIAQLWWVMLAGAGAIQVLVLALLAASLRRRGGGTASERAWIVSGGIALPLLVLPLLVGFALWTGERLLPAGSAITVDATASQWQWTFRHPGAQGPIERVNHLHLPAGQAVDIRITSTDVIHSLWVPRLAGKLDAIPGKVNTLRLDARTPGTFDGQCAEFCGVGHARMPFRVTVHDSASWTRFIGGAPQ